VSLQARRGRGEADEFEGVGVCSVDGTVVEGGEVDGVAAAAEPVCGEDAGAGDLSGAVAVDVSDGDFVEVADGDDDDLEDADVDAAAGDVASLGDPSDLLDVVGDQSAELAVVGGVDELLGEGDGVASDRAACFGRAQRLGESPRL
jgi:hypothetical protein